MAGRLRRDVTELQILQIGRIGRGAVVRLSNPSCPLGRVNRAVSRFSPGIALPEAGETREAAHSGARPFSGPAILALGGCVRNSKYGCVSQNRQDFCSRPVRKSPKQKVIVDDRAMEMVLKTALDQAGLPVLGRAGDVGAVLRIASRVVAEPEFLPQAASGAA